MFRLILTLICSFLICLFVQAQDNLWPDPSFTNSMVGFSPQVAERPLNNAAG